MMADEIKVSTQVLLDTAEKVRTINTTMDGKLADINKTMNDLESTWRSDAATDIRAAMNALKPRFEEYKTVVESYAKFLVNTAQSYDVTETSIQNNAGAFK
ncbi:MAG TPA: WXG100 family type VII secretion target [Eubacterium sp.]|nr:WXG100 family type VII secretion target [Eubacterium sp.]HAX59313.1 WXG100 family type VII secretion target [Eubacterium sp.]HAZ87216.1 WXG100 family type VII secretion target [Eubacterium sp.]